jgi:hypothetical protein
MTKNLCMIQGDYRDLKFIKTRGVAQVVIEIPETAQDEFVDMFGTPRQGFGVPVVISRMVTRQAEPSPQPPQNTPEPSPELPLDHAPKGGALSRQAALTCRERAFWEFLSATGLSVDRPETEEEAAAIVRALCSSTPGTSLVSRATLDHDPVAAQKWSDLLRSYRAWYYEDNVL